MSEDQENKVDCYIKKRDKLLSEIENVVDSMNPFGKVSKLLEIYKELYFNERALSDWKMHELRKFLYKNDMYDAT